MIMELFAHNPAVQMVALLCALSAILVPVTYCFQIYSKRQSFKQDQQTRRDTIIESKPGKTLKVVEYD